jgi:hypothetical protein
MTPAVALLIVRVLLAVCLYLFLATALAILWRDLRRAGSGRSVPAPAAHLVRLEVPEAQGADPAGEISLLGRAADNTIRIDDPTFVAASRGLPFGPGNGSWRPRSQRHASQRHHGRGPLVITYGTTLSSGSDARASPRRPRGVEPERRPSAASRAGTAEARRRMLDEERRIDGSQASVGCHRRFGGV